MILVVAGKVLAFICDRLHNQIPLCATSVSTGECLQPFQSFLTQLHCSLLLGLAETY